MTRDAAPHDAAPGPATTPTEADAQRADRRRTLVGRRLAALVSAAVVAWAGFAVPLPFVEYVPSSPTAIPPLVEIDGAPVTELVGETAILTVILRQQPTIPAFVALLDPRRSLVPVEAVYPPGVDRLELREAERERFGRQFELAAAVGAAAAGFEAEVVTEVVVVEVFPGTAADGLLRPGDTVVGVDGAVIHTGEQLQQRTAAADVGDELRLEVLRDGERLRLTARLGTAGDEDQARLGVQVQTAVERLELPFGIGLADGTRIGGPSAGLLVGLTVYDLLAEEDLLAGRTVVGTGTLDADGLVGPVGGVPAKMRAAADYGADLVLVPARQLASAREADPDLHVVGVTTFEEALDALRATR